MTSPIKFGTDGWRAIIADGFTFERVREVSAAIAVSARDLKVPDSVSRTLLVVGFDRRFLSTEFARAAAEVLRDSGYRVLLSKSPTPSQTVSHAVKHHSALGGVVITASHNPANYNGVKFKGWYGGSALPEMYASIASNLGRTDRRAGGSIEEVDLLEDYVATLRERVEVGLITRSRMRILHDPIYGVSASIPSRVLGIDYVGSHPLRWEEPSPLMTVSTIRGEVNPSFGGVNPEPIPENLAASRDVMRSGIYALAICNDGDADRVGVLDERGEFVSPHKMIALLALYLVRTKGLKGEIVKTFSTSRLVEKVARSLGAPFHETAIGFKYVADLMLKRNILLGGEESGGIGFGDFLPERDGILSGLLIAECVAAYGKKLSVIVREMEDEFGALHYQRRDINRAQTAITALMDRAQRGDLDRTFGDSMRKREETDGIKLNFADGSWLLFRKSGTEPIIRIYCESPDERRVTEMLDRAVVELDRVG